MITAALLSTLLLLFVLLTAVSGWNDVLSPARNELVFAERNRAYGAYVMRREHHRTMILAFIMGLGVVMGALLIPKFFATPVVEIPSLPQDNEGVVFDIHPPRPDIPPPSPAPRPASNAAFTGVITAIDSVAPTLDTTTAVTPAIVGPVGPVGPPSGPVGTGTAGIIDTADTRTPIEYADMAPEYPGGMDALYADIGDEMKYPRVDIDSGRQGQVRLVFVVDENGMVSDITVSRGVSRTIDAEAVRVFRTLKKWKPGTFKGKPVRTRYGIPIKFVLRN